MTCSRPFTGGLIDLTRLLIQSIAGIQTMARWENWTPVQARGDSGEGAKAA